MEKRSNKYTTIKQRKIRTEINRNKNKYIL